MENPRNYIALAVPFFFLFIGVELAAAKLVRRRAYRLADALADLGCGVAQQTAMVFFAAALLAAYAAVYERARLVTLHGAAEWAFAFLAVDFVYYAWHRASHRVNFLWAAHAVHHQSEDYNLAVALRQAILTGFTSLPFYLPLALLGVSPLAYASCVSLNTLYQFWIHTELVGKLPRPVEWLMNTPSHHRVHHAVNERYLDKNYAGVFIVWDRLLGTFVAEAEPCRFGTVRRLESFNPLWAQVAELKFIAEKARGGGALDKARVWLMPPEWTARGDKAVPPPPAEKHASPASARAQLYAAAQFAAVVVVTFLMLLHAHDAPRALLAAGGAFVFLSLAATGALLDGWRFARSLELARLALVAAALFAFIRVA